ncbi:hypothetical protein GJ496_003301 [Pomphorhynchus laevis]|nr:hypothetical protein GJ496_003301 [Pomphorhynchus laevis]
MDQMSKDMHRNVVHSVSANRNFRRIPDTIIENQDNTQDNEYTGNRSTQTYPPVNSSDEPMWTSPSRQQNQRSHAHQQFDLNHSHFDEHDEEFLPFQQRSNYHR